MKTLHDQRLKLKMILSILPTIGVILFLSGCQKNPQNGTPVVTVVASGMAAPMGLETDWHGNVWIAETGTAHNDGKVVFVKPENGMDKGNAKVYDAIINLSSIKNAISNEDEGPANLLFDNGWLYILAGDYLYRVNISSFKPGDAPIDASKLPYEDLGAYVRSLNIVTPNDSHPYNLIKGPDGMLYIADAGANAIIKREGKGKYSLFAKFPDMDNPTIVGPPKIQSVPTGILFDGRNYLVSTLTGFPFLQGQAVIYKVTLNGDVSVYQSGFTTLTNIARGNFYGHAVLHFGSFGATGFVPKSGSLILTKGDNDYVLADGLNMPVGLGQINDQSWYVTSMGDGTLLKISYH